MSPRALIVLLSILVILGFLASIQLREARLPVPQSERDTSVPLLDDFDLNTIMRVDITSGDAAVRLAKKGNAWVVASLYDYPADFVRLAGSLRYLTDLTVGQWVRDGLDYLEDYGLADGEDVETPPVRVVLSDASGTEKVRLTLGAERLRTTAGSGPGFPAGRFVRVDEGQVLLVEDTLDAFVASDDVWIQKSLVSVPFNEVKEVTVATPDSSYTLYIEGENRFRLSDLKEGEEVLNNGALRLGRGLQSLRFRELADPSLADADLGFDAPYTYTLLTRNGMHYTLLLGKPTPDESGRYARIQVAYLAPPPPTREDVEASLPPPPVEATEGDANAQHEQQIQDALQARLAAYEQQAVEKKQAAEELQQTVHGWTYVLASHLVEPMTLSRDAMVKKTEPEAAESAPTSP